MKKRLVFGIIGRFMIIEAILMILPAVVSFIYGEYNSINAFLLSALIAAATGVVLCIQTPKNKEFYAKEGFITIGMMWVMWSLAGALPFLISGEIPNYIDAVFETVSGFTTTGATILTDIEKMSNGMLFWRSFTHWIGGMGVLVFVMAFVNISSNNAIHLMRAEVPGPSVSKLVPRGMSNSKILYGIYFGLCVIEFIMLVCGGMPIYDSIIHTMSTAGTGGFSCKNASVAAYNSSYIEWVITAFMFLFSINFNMYFYLIIRRFSSVAKDSEWKVFTLIVLSATLLIALSVRNLYTSLSQTIRVSAFQVVSVISTTGFCTADYNLWNGFTKIIIIVLMTIGACAGSTGGGIKVSRLMILVKSAFKTIKTMISPKSVYNIKIDGKVIDNDTVRNVSGYFILYMLIAGISCILVGIDKLTFEEILSSVSTCINNIGPGFGIVGPVGNFSTLTPFSKIVLTLDMLLGRLEIYPILFILIPSMWKRKFI